jgi:hypothetical protein
MNRPILGVSKSDDSADGGRLDDGTECFVVVHPGTLSKAAKNPAGFVVVKGAVSMELVPENPFPSNHICLSKTLNKIPSMVVMESSTLIFHGLVPVGISQSIAVRARDRGECLRMQGDTGLLVPGLVAGGHAVCVYDWWDGDGASREGGSLLDEARRGWDDGGAARRAAWGRVGHTSGVDADDRRLGASRSWGWRCHRRRGQGRRCWRCRGWCGQGRRWGGGDADGDVAGAGVGVSSGAPGALGPGGAGGGEVEATAGGIDQWKRRERCPWARRGAVSLASDGPSHGEARGWALGPRGRRPRNARRTCRGKKTCTGVSSVRKSRLEEEGESCLREKGRMFRRRRHGGR